MNVTALKIGAKMAAQRAAFFMQKHAPQILVGTGVAGFIGTVVLGCKATLKAEHILDEKDAKLQKIEEFDPEGGEVYSEKDRAHDAKVVKTQTAISLVKAYAPTVTLGAASTVMILSGHHILGKRAAALSAAYKAAEATLYKYRENVTKQFGSEVDRRLSEGLAIDKLEGPHTCKDEAEKDENLPAKTDESKGLSEFCWLFSEESCGPRIHGSGLWRDDPSLNWHTLVQAQRYAQDRLVCQGYLHINDILIDQFGADGTTIGSEYGWVWDDVHGHDQIDFGLGDINTDEGLRRFLAGSEPNVWLRFNARKESINDKIDDIMQRKRAKRRGWTRK